MVDSVTFMLATLAFSCLTLSSTEARKCYEFGSKGTMKKVHQCCCESDGCNESFETCLAANPGVRIYGSVVAMTIMSIVAIIAVQ